MNDSFKVRLNSDRHLNKRAGSFCFYVSSATTFTNIEAVHDGNYISEEKKNLQDLVMTKDDRFAAVPCSMTNTASRISVETMLNGPDPLIVTPSPLIRVPSR